MPSSFEAPYYGTFCHHGAKVTKCAAMPARFVTHEVVTNRAAIVPFKLGYQYAVH